MNSLDELLHPVTLDQFRAEYEDRKPLHVPAETDRRKAAALTWSAFNALLDQSSLWTAGSLRLMRNHTPVPPEEYCRPVKTPDGTVMRPSAGMVEVFLSAGASAVANDVLHLHPPLTRIGQALGETYAALVGANVYCSFQGVRAFGTHFDNHDVFVIQTEGEKVWTLYENRALNPVDPPEDTAETRRWFEQTRGRVLQEIVMRPGDVLYLPRGWYHDALATEGASLHVTFSVTPLYGRILLSLLDNAAMQNPAFRAWLPPAHQDEGRALQQRLAELGEMLAAIVATPEFRDEVAMAQRRLIARPAGFSLPTRKPVTLYRTTGRAFPRSSTALGVIYGWAIQERQFALEEMIAQFDFLSEQEVRDGVDAAEKAGALEKL